jgi:hypothetical protein
MSLDFMSKAQIRRHLKVPFAATPAGNVTMGLRTVTRAGQLELYMSVLAPEEEAILLGQPYGLLQFYGPWSAGQVLSVGLANFSTPAITGEVNYTVQTSDVTSALPWLTIATNVAQQLTNLSSNLGLGIISASGVPTDPLHPPVSSPPFGQITLRSNNLFMVTVSGAGLALIANGTSYPAPSYTNDTTTYYGLLPVCNALESDLLSISPQLAFDVAGSTATGQVVFRKEALRQHVQLYKYYVKQMGVALGFYPAYGASGGSRSFGIVV